MKTIIDGVVIILFYCVMVGITYSISYKDNYAHYSQMYDTMAKVDFMASSDAAVSSLGWPLYWPIKLGNKLVEKLSK